MSFNPFALSVCVRGLTVRESGSETAFVSLGKLYANIKLTSILHLAPVLKELRLADLHVHLFEFKDLDVPIYLAYLPAPLRVKVPSALLPGGQADAHLPAGEGEALDARALRPGNAARRAPST